jgi:branched-chain amino acid transport system ATP-binding protein
MGFLPVRSGQILFHGEEVTSLPSTSGRCAEWATRPKEGDLPELTVAENMMTAAGCRRRRGALEASPTATSRAGVRGVSRGARVAAPPGMNLSAASARWSPSRAAWLAPTLLLDEAFEGLAPVVVNRFREAVLKIQDLGISLLIAESNLMNAARIADRLYAIDRGEIIFEGKPEQALEDPNVMKALRG